MGTFPHWAGFLAQLCRWVGGVTAPPSPAPSGCAVCIPWAPQLGHGSQVLSAELVCSVTTFGWHAAVGMSAKIKEGFVGHLTLRVRGCHGPGVVLG